MNLDLSQYRKIEAGDKHTTLEHASGNRLKIAHHGLSEEFKKKLEDLPVNMAKGGNYSKFSQKFDPNMGSKASKPSKPNNTPGMPASKTFTEPQDMGTDIPKVQLQEELNDKQLPDVVVSSLNRKAPPFGPLSSDESQHYPPCINPSCKSFGKSHPHCSCYGGNSEHSGVGAAGHFAGGGEVKKEYYCDANRMHRKGCKLYAEGSKDGPVESDSDKLEKVAQEVNSESQSLPEDNLQDISSSQAPAPLPVPTPASSPVNPNPEMAQEQDPVSSPDGEQPNTVQDDTQRAPSSSEDTMMPPAEQFQKYKSDHMQQMLNEQGNFQDELDSGKITPQHYFHLFGRDGTLGKIGSAFGLMLGGIGSGLTHQPNAALEIMQNEINNDLKAQELSSQNKQNFLKINQQGLLNQAQEAQMSQETKSKAYALSKMQMNYAALHSLVQNAAKLPPGSPQRQQADQQLAMLNQGVQNENFNIADRAATASALGQYLSGGGTGANTQLMKTGLMGPEGKEAGEDIEQKTYPGLGKSSIPLSGSDREQINSGLTFQRSLNNFINWTKSHSGDLNPKDAKFGQALAAQLQGQYRQVTHGGVYKAGEQDFINKIINDNPTAFFNKVRNIPSLQAVKADSANQFDQLVKGKGFPGYKEAQGGNGGGGGTMMSKSGRPMVQKNGKWIYQ